MGVYVGSVHAVCTMDSSPYDHIRDLCSRWRGLPQGGTYTDDTSRTARGDTEAPPLAETRRAGCRCREHVFSGKAGQGKTAAAKAELAELEAFADSQNLELTTVFFSCEGISSSYTLACGLCEQLSGTNPNGHSMQKVLEHLWSGMNETGGTVIIVLRRNRQPRDRRQDSLLAPACAGQGLRQR